LHSQDLGMYGRTDGRRSANLKAHAQFCVHKKHDKTELKTFDA